MGAFPRHGGTDSGPGGPGGTLTPATVAAEAEGLLAEIAAEVERERRESQARTQADLLGKKLPDSPPPKPDDQKTATKAAALFGTNRTYVNQAVPPVDGTGGKRK